MNRSPFHTLLDRLAAEAIPPIEVDLWSAIRARYETRKAHPKGVLLMKTSFATNRLFGIIAVSILVILLITAALLFTPQGRALARSALQFFTRAESETIPAPTSEPLVWVEQNPGVPAPTLTPLLPSAPFAAECGDYTNGNKPHCSIEQVRTKVNFTVKELGIIPEGMYFVGATGGPQEVVITYGSSDHSRFIWLNEQPWTGKGEQKSFEVAPGVTVEIVSIGGVTGEYVKGSFGYTSGETQETWKSDTGQETLKWNDQEVYYTLAYISNTQPQGKDGLAALAASLTTEPVSANVSSLPTTATSEPTFAPHQWTARFPLTPSQASEQAGFNVWVPDKISTHLIFIGVNYDSEYSVATLAYLLDCGDCDNGLLLFEQPVSEGGNCRLCKPFTVGDAQYDMYLSGIVGVNAKIETVQIDDATGQYVEGEWAGRDNHGMKWYTDLPTQSIRWQKDGMAFELHDMSWDLSKEDVIAIAESLVVAPAPAQAPVLANIATSEIPDLKAQYPLSFTQAEAQAGFNVRTPASLPEILSFLGARYDTEYGVVTAFYLLDQNQWGPNTDGLVLNEQLATEGADCELCGFVTGDLAAAEASYSYKVVGSDASIEIVQIGDISGQYVEGTWEANDNSGMKWTADPYLMILRWQKNGTAFELIYLGMEITKADLIAIAESIP